MQFTTFRLAAYETPLWAVENFTPGRYSDVGDGATQYLSLHPMTPWAELLRNQQRRTAEAALQLRVPLWTIKVTLDEPPLEITFDNSEDHGLAPGDLVADDQTACRELASRLRGQTEMARAIMVPSAALPGTRNLVLLDPYVAVSFSAEPVAAEDLPTAIAAQDGRCPDGLWDLVHHRDSAREHAALEAWQAGEDFVFSEPAVTLDVIV